MRKLKLALFSMIWWLGVAAAPPAACLEDWQCTDDHFCLKTSRICQPCLRCEDLKREPPTIADKCVKTVVDCGACIKDFVERQSDHPLECVEPGATSSGLPPLMWTLIALAPLVLIGICVFVCIYLDRIPFKLKINSQVHAAVTNGHVQSTGASNGAGDRATQPAASAPEGPPPYDELDLTRVDSPVGDVSPNPHYDNESQPFIRTKSVQQSRQRQTSGTQAANVFNGPHYVRGPQVPRNTEGPAEEPPIGEYDEATAESGWTANNGDSGANAHSDPNANASTSAGATSLAYANTSETPSPSPLSVQLAVARNTTLVRPVTVGPPAKVSRRSQGYHRSEQQDSNNNDGESSGGSEGGAPKSATTTSVPINLLITNMNVVGRSLNIALPRVD